MEANWGYALPRYCAALGRVNWSMWLKSTAPTSVCKSRSSEQALLGSSMVLFMLAKRSVAASRGVDRI